MTALAAALVAAPVAFVIAASPVSSSAAIAYPQTRRVDVVDDHFGQQVADRYRWLENDVRSDQEVAAWVEAQNKVTDAYLATLPGRDIFKQRLTKLFNYERFSVPTKKGGRYFYLHNAGLQNQSVLYVRDSVDGKGRVLIDPNTWSKDVMDMLRFDKFTGGDFWSDEYGSPGVATDFRNLYRYSPYHNIRSGVTYPAILATTADTDDRVVPGHTFKYTPRYRQRTSGRGRTSSVSSRVPVTARASQSTRRSRRPRTCGRSRRGGRDCRSKRSPKIDCNHAGPGRPVAEYQLTRRNNFASGDICHFTDM